MTAHGQDVAAVEGRLVAASAGMNAALSELVRVRRELTVLLRSHPSGVLPASAVGDVLAGSNGRLRC